MLRPRHLTLRSAWRAVAVAAVACLLLSCASRPSEDTRTGSDAKASDGTAARTPGDARQSEIPAELPAGARPKDLAGHLDRAVAVLRDENAAAAELRAAGEFQQQAIRLLATKRRSFGRAVVARLSPQAARVTRSCIRAARALDAMGGPARRLPPWRIVTPRSADELYAHYRRAQARTGVSWTYLAAINLVETRMGRIRGTSTAGARGPMQFIAPTWARYGAGGDINDPRDAILAAARLLDDHGAPRNMARALYHYNPSDRYVRAVLIYAETMQRTRWAYRAFWHWRVFYSHTRGTYVLTYGYPKTRPRLLPDS